MEEGPLYWIAMIAIGLLLSKFFPSYRSKKKKRTALQEHEARGETKAPAVKQSKLSLKNKMFMAAVFVLCMIALIVHQVYLYPITREIRRGALDWFYSLFGL